MEKKKIILILLIILIIIITCIFVYIVFIYKHGQDMPYDENDEFWQSHLQLEEDKNLHKVTNSVDFYAVENCINKYLTYLSINFNEPQNIDKEDVKYVPDDFAESMNITNQEQKNSAILKMLDSKFIQENGITEENLDSHINFNTGNINFEAEQMNIIPGENIDTYAAYGKIYNNDTNEVIDNAYYRVSIDNNNLTFMIEPLKNEYENIDKISLESRINEIKENDVNVVEYNMLSDYDMSLKYFTHYQLNAINDPENAYTYLDNQYKEKRFGSLEEYRNYVTENKEKVSGIVLEKYKVEKTDESIKYICLDQYGNYYIFTENAIMDYSVILDTYTIDLPEFTEKYNSGTEQQKVALNIDKFMQSINAKDYKYAYGCLADSFKNNYFKTLEDFENYAKENFYVNSTVGYNEFNVQGDVYSYSVTLKDKETGEQKSKTFVMQLNEGTDFVLSFNR